MIDGGKDGEGAKDTSACATTGERGMVVVWGHGFFFVVCVERPQKK